MLYLQRPGGWVVKGCEGTDLIMLILNRHVFTHFQKISTLIYDRVYNNFKQERDISSTGITFRTPSNYQAGKLR